VQKITVPGGRGKKAPSLNKAAASGRAGAKSPLVYFEKEQEGIMKRFFGLLSLAVLVGIVACEHSELGLISGPQFKPDKGGQSDPAVPLIAAFRDAPEDMITSDGRGPYVDGSCGVVAEITRGNPKAWFFPSGRPIKGKEKQNCGDPRRYNILLPDGSSWTGMVVVDSVRQVQVGQPELHWAAFKSEFCPFRFTENYDGLDGDRALITRIDDETWQVESTNLHRAVCTTEFGSTVYHLPFALIFTLK
jgi:hypothetical protein